MKKVFLLGKEEREGYAILWIRHTSTFSHIEGTAAVLDGVVRRKFINFRLFTKRRKIGSAKWVLSGPLLFSNEALGISKHSSLGEGNLVKLTLLFNPPISVTHIYHEQK